ncbi:MAG: hypothetical protein IJH39_05265 [Clostridia bacterium]|nr:hypothetical protein [Clostridia bacterium]
MNNTIIFSNECTSGRYYKVNKLQYNNPIIWHHWPINNYIEFIKNFDNVNLSNYEILPIDGDTYFKNMYNFEKNSKLTYYVKIDNKYKIAYSHYIFNKTEKISGDNKYSPNIKEYVVQKYETRLKRYNSEQNKQIVFLFGEKKYTSIEDELKFINVITPYKKFLYTSHKELLKYKNDNMVIIYNDHINHDKVNIDFSKELNKYL